MSSAGKAWFCYMVRCRDGSLYVGIAIDPAERAREHNWGVGATFTAKRRPVELVWFEQFCSEGEAHKREVELKGWSRKKKLREVEWFARRERAAMRGRPPVYPEVSPQSGRSRRADKSGVA